MNVKLKLDKSERGPVVVAGVGDRWSQFSSIIAGVQNPHPTTALTQIILVTIIVTTYITITGMVSEVGSQSSFLSLTTLVLLIFRGCSHITSAKMGGS